jgi:hypothetical protein
MRAEWEAAHVLKMTAHHEIRQQMLVEAHINQLSGMAKIACK